MSESNYSLTVDLVVRLINCPGVWLCPNGLVSLSFKMLGSRSRTAAVTPIFPLIFNTAFNFTKTFKNIDSESKVHEALARETVCCELLQWPYGYKKGQGRILATYVGILEDLLYPPEVCISSQIDLLMKPACLFPGILAPKIEIVNKATIKKIDDKSSSRRKSEDQKIFSDRQNDSDQQIINNRRYSAQPSSFYDRNDNSRTTLPGRRSGEKPTSDTETDNAQLMSNGRKHKKDSSSDDQCNISPPSQDKPRNICSCNQRDQSPRHQKPVCHSPRNKLSSSRSSSVPPTKRKKQHLSKFCGDQKFVLVCSVRRTESADREDSDRGAREPRSYNSSSRSSKEVSDTTSSPSHEWYQCEVCSEYDTTFENIPEAISKSKYKTVDVHLEGDLESMCTIKLATKMHERLNKILSKYGSGIRYR